MKDEEKLLLLQLILEDLRGNWGWEKEERQPFALQLANELIGVKGMSTLVERISDYNTGEDGRYFRATYPCGYYEMEATHGLKKTFKDKTEEFKGLAARYLTYPEYAFSDYPQV